MKRLLTLLLVLVVTLSTFVGFTRTSAPKIAEKYSTTYYTEVKTLCPYYLTDTTAQYVVANTQDGLVENDRFGRIVPSLALNWTNNKDYTVWTFKLRQGVKWVDSKGNKTKYEVTANDFVDGMRYVADPKNGAKNVSIITKEIKGLNNYYKNLSGVDTNTIKNMTRQEVLASFDKTVGVKAIDKYTLQYTTERAVPYFLSYLVTELFIPVQGQFLASVGDENYGITKEKLLFTGPYVLSDWQRDKAITLKQNNFYWDKAHVYVKSVNFQKINDYNVGLQMFQRGELSYATIPGDQVLALKGGKLEQYINQKPKTSVTGWFHPNFDSSNPEWMAFVNNANFRRALYYGIDRAALQSLSTPYKPENLLRNTIIPEDTIFDTKGVDYTDYPALKEIKAKNTYDPKLAKVYMDKAIKELVSSDGKIKGVKAKTVDMNPIAKFDVDGKLPVQMVYIHGTDSVETKTGQLMKALLEQNLGAKNVNVVLGQYTDDKYNDAVEPKKYDLAFETYSFKYADPMAQFGRITTGGSCNDGYYKDLIFDKMVDNASKITDINKRYTAFSQAESYLINRNMIIPWIAGGGDFMITKVVPFQTPKGGFGLSRFKYKGMSIQDKAVTTTEWKKYEKQFAADLKKVQGK